MEKIRAIVQAPDPVSLAGIAGMLESTPGLEVLAAEAVSKANVVVLCCGRLAANVLTMLRRSASTTGLPVVLVIDQIDASELLVAVENRVVAILPRGAVTVPRLAHAVVTAADGGGVLPPHLVGELLKQVERLQREVLTPNGLNPSALSSREIDVVRLMAEGWDTSEIANKLRYSERTVKNVIHGVTTRLKLRNRSHAVAYALRTGMM
jgi:DNA-binding NarL/FixJ family response regulator